MLNRDADGLALRDQRAREALNLAVDRTALVREVFPGHARPLASVTPPTPLTAAHRAPDRLLPYPLAPGKAARLWREAGGQGCRPLRLVAPNALYAVNNHVDFTPYATTFELAATSVTEEHWSRRPGG